MSRRGAAAADLFARPACCLRSRSALRAARRTRRWYPSWAADGNLYTSWTDGSVDGHSSGSGGHGATTGFATVLGDDPFALTLANVSVYAEPADPYQGR